MAQEKIAMEAPQLPAKNKGGRPKKYVDPRSLFQQEFDKVVTRDDWRKYIEASKENPKEFKYIIDQRIGKSAQGIEHSGPQGGAITFKWMTKTEAKERTEGAEE